MWSKLLELMPRSAFKKKKKSWFLVCPCATGAACAFKERRGRKTKDSGREGGGEEGGEGGDGEGG